MREIKIFDRGDKVAIAYEVDSLIFKNGQIYYKLKDPTNGMCLDNAYTADELIAVDKEKKNEVSEL